MRRALLWGWVIAVGCAPADATRDREPVVVDSAGVQIVTHAPLSEWQWGVRLIPIANIDGVTEGDTVLFSSIVGGQVLPDGSIVLVDQIAHEVRRFSRDGLLLGRHGREGEGPGEYRHIIGVGRCAPTGFTVFDLGHVLSYYSDSGEFEREFSVQLDGGSNPYELACSQAGRFAVLNWDRGVMGTRGVHTAYANLQLVGAGGEITGSLGERIGSVRFGTPTGAGPHPTGLATKLAFSGAELIVADGSFFGYERWSPSGELMEIVRIDVPEPDGDSIMAEYTENAMERARDDEQQARWREEIAQMGVTDPVTYVSELFARETHVLLREASIRGSGRWFAFTSAGDPLGYVPVPEGGTFLDLRDGHLLVSVRDELDVPSARLFQIGS